MGIHFNQAQEVNETVTILARLSSGKLRWRPTASLPSPSPFGRLALSLRGQSLLAGAVLVGHSLWAEPSASGLTAGELVPWLLLQGAFLLVLLWSAGAAARRAAPLNLVPARLVTDTAGRWLLLGLMLQSALALIGNAVIDGNSVLAAQLMLVTAQLALLLPGRAATAWVTVQTAVLLAIYLHNWPVGDALAFGTGYFCLQLFTVHLVQTTLEAMRAREQLSLALQDLREARERLSEATRRAERLEISRELHDSVGHHLASLHLRLQLAEASCPPGELAGQLTGLRETARQLGQELRRAVRSMRGEATRDLHTELAGLLRAAPLPVHLRLDPALRLSCPLRVHALLRTVQELITNTARHAGAHGLWLKVEHRGGELLLDADDDGTGRPDLTPGCGLSGMHERIENLGGHLEFADSARGGLAVRVRIPLHE